MLNYDFDWSVVWRAPYGEMMLQGIQTTLKLSILAWVLAVFLGMLVAVLQVLPYRIPRFLGAAYVQLFRNTPFLVQLFFLYFALPLVFPKATQTWFYDSVPDHAFWLAVLGLGLFTSSRLAELFRSGLSAIGAGQYRAAYSTGLNTYQAYRHVILPHAFRIIIPAFTTEFLTCFKNSALAMTIGVMEITHTAYYIDSFTWHGLETTTAASLLYLAIALCIAFLMWLLERRLAMPGMIKKERNLWT